MESDMLSSSLVQFRGGLKWLFRTFPDMSGQGTDATADPGCHSVFIDAETSGNLAVFEPAGTHAQDLPVFAFELGETVGEQFLRLFRNQKRELVSGRIRNFQPAL